MLTEGRAALLVVFAAFGFALISILTVVATREGLALSMLMLIRFAVAAVTLTPFVLREPPQPTDGGRITRIVVAGGIGQSIVGVLSLAALAWIPAATLVVLFYTFPAWVTLVAAWRKTEPLTRRRVVALALSLAGILSLVGLPGSDAIHPTGVLLALSAAAVYAVYVPLMGKLQRGFSATRTTWLISLGVTTVFVVATPLRGEFTMQLTTTAWMAAVVVGVFSTAVGLLAFMRGLAVLGSVRTSIVCTVEPLFAATLAALFLDQPITLPMAAGGTLILAAVIVLSLPASTDAPEPARQSSPTA